MSTDVLWRLYDALWRACFRRWLSPYIDAELGPTAARRVKRHLARCPRCQRECSKLERAARVFASLTLPDAPPDGFPELDAFLSASPAMAKAPSRRLRLALGTALVLIAAGAFAVWRSLNASGLDVIALSGQPSISGNGLADVSRLAPGGLLETDDGSRARLVIGSLGRVDVSPGSRLRLVAASSGSKRLALELGRIDVSFTGPPGALVVETPSATATDLGCAYWLEVDAQGVSTLGVTEGSVELRSGSVTSFVRSGFRCRALPSGVVGTPVRMDALDSTVKALERFDFEAGGRAALSEVLAGVGPGDVLTLWHLLSRTEGVDRAEVYRRLSELAPRPDGVTREGVLALDAAMLLEWRYRIEDASSGVSSTVAHGRLRPTRFPLRARRGAHTATRLVDGRVLIAGGLGLEGPPLKSAELFDPSTETFASTGDMVERRVGHSATLLGDGRVLVMGGVLDETGWVAPAEIFDPSSGTFRKTGTPGVNRSGHQATLLLDGRVLVVGGYGDDGRKLAAAELFDPATGRFSPTSDMREPRVDHTATVLVDGRVLIAGGASREWPAEIVSATAELYDPAAGRFVETGSMAIARCKHGAGLLADGTVLLVGGADERLSLGMLAVAERYDPKTGTFATLLDVGAARYKIGGGVAVLPSGEVLVAGGGATAELICPEGTFARVPGSETARNYYLTATTLADGRVLLAGGSVEFGSSDDRAWIFEP